MVAYLLTSIAFFRWDLNLPVILDFEIWKASNMLFQNIPNGFIECYERCLSKEGHENKWDDSWYESFEELTKAS